MKKSPLRQKHIWIAISLALATQLAPSLVNAQDKLSPSPTASELSEETAFDLLSLYREAAQNDPTFNAARSGMLAGKESFWQGLSVLLPQANGTWSTNQGKLNYINGSPYSNSNQRDYSSTGWTVKLTQPLLNWGKFEQFRQGDINADIAQAQFALAEYDLIIRVSQAYFNLLTALDNIELYKNKKYLISQQLEQAKRNFEIGTSTIVDTNDAQARYDLVVAQEIAAQSDLVIKRSALEQIIGRPVPSIKTLDKTAQLDGLKNKELSKEKRAEIAKKIRKAGVKANIAQAINLPAGQTMDDWAKQSEEVSFGVLISKLNLNLAESNMRGAIAGHAPYVDLVASRGYTNQTASTTASSATPSQSFNSQIGVQVTIPLFAGGYTQSVVRQMSALKNQANDNYTLARRNAVQTTRQAYLGFTNGLAQVKAYESAEISALSSVESNKLGYDVGVKINIDVLNSLDQLFTTRASLYQARYNTIMNGLTLKAQASILSDEDLMAINALLK